MEKLNEFIVNKETASITIRREFEADNITVWKAWTTAEILDQWWAPFPWTSKTSRMNFEIGGTRLYAMCSPEGEEHWGITKYHDIVPLKWILGEDFFCDEKGNMNSELPSSTFEQSFTESGSMTLVTIETKYGSLTQLETVISMGFRKGITAVLLQLDELLTKNK